MLLHKFSLEEVKWYAVCGIKGFTERYALMTTNYSEGNDAPWPP
jgi:hypothetical protein